uniref:HMG box domain-containing protein n=1 Tax=Pediculus humanus subsp. corporis TaxID=121224 RepID=A0A2Y9D477_PEDHC
MGCGGCAKKKRSMCPKKRKKLPSINPFFHFLKCVWRKFRGCKRSVVVRYAVKKWRRMSKSEKQPFFAAACKAQELHRQSKKKNCSQATSQSCPPPCPPPCPKPKCKKKKKSKCPKC